MNSAECLLERLKPYYTQKKQNPIIKEFLDDYLLKNITDKTSLSFEKRKKYTHFSNTLVHLAMFGVCVYPFIISIVFFYNNYQNFMLKNSFLISFFILIILVSMFYFLKNYLYKTIKNKLPKNEKKFIIEQYKNLLKELIDTELVDEKNRKDKTMIIQHLSEEIDKWDCGIYKSFIKKNVIKIGDSFKERKNYKIS